MPELLDFDRNGKVEIDDLIIALQTAKKIQEGKISVIDLIMLVKNLIL
jgi:hypothetical protein